MKTNLNSVERAPTDENGSRARSQSIQKPLVDPTMGSAPPVPDNPNRVADFWTVPATITPNNFVYKSLSNWAFNTAIGCAHACRFCYVPSAATVKQGPALKKFGVDDPDAEWGDYVFLRPWDEEKFLASLRAAERTAAAELKADGNRAVMYCSTTDPYQVIYSPDPQKRRELNDGARKLVTRSLELIRDNSTLNVRILTRSPLAKRDFDLFKSFGPRLVFGMSLPTLNEKLTRVYEPKAPSPAHRLTTLRAAAEAGLHVYVAIAPTYPECDEADLAETLKAVAALNPTTVFHEPINIRAENVERIENHAKSLGISVRTDVFETPARWQEYALGALTTVERLAGDVGLSERLHLWPDKSLGSKAALARMDDPDSHRAWLESWWYRISEWPSASLPAYSGLTKAHSLKSTSTSARHEGGSL